MDGCHSHMKESRDVLYKPAQRKLERERELESSSKGKRKTRKPVEIASTTFSSSLFLLLMLLNFPLSGIFVSFSGFYFHLMFIFNGVSLLHQTYMYYKEKIFYFMLYLASYVTIHFKIIAIYIISYCANSTQKKLSIFSIILLLFFKFTGCLFCGSFCQGGSASLLSDDHSTFHRYANAGRQLAQSSLHLQSGWNAM